MCVKNPRGSYAHKSRESVNGLSSDAISDEDIDDIEKLRVPRHATHQGLSCDKSFVSVR